MIPTSLPEDWTNRPTSSLLSTSTLGMHTSYVILRTPRSTTLLGMACDVRKRDKSGANNRIPLFTPRIMSINNCVDIDYDAMGFCRESSVPSYHRLLKSHSFPSFCFWYNHNMIPTYAHTVQY
ncbi:hypothetical protein RJT34_32141 [Clitoria ternatea]|uniref:Uncharacterized protein n=1 Tax=Clitoria ternatea TaxID=43366 RepID=A0AAN9I3H2_CLITE